MIKKISKQDFQNRFLYTNGGISVLIYLYERLLSRFGKDLNQNHLEKCLSALINHLKSADLKPYTDRLNSEGGRKGVVEEFISIIALDLGDKKLQDSVNALLDYKKDAEQLEAELRDYLNTKISTANKNWIKNMLDPGTYKMIRKRYEQRSIEDTRELYGFLTLGEIRNLLSRKDILKIIKDDFIGRRGHFVTFEDFIGSLDLIIKYRNPPSHGTYLKIDHNKLQRIKISIETFKKCLELYT